MIILNGTENPVSTQVTARQLNWLPLPQAGLTRAVETKVDENDLFPKGEVASYFPRQGYGFIKDRNGNEVYFKLDELELVGPKADKNYISVGAKIGYDISCTSKGPHVRALKIY